VLFFIIVLENKKKDCSGCMCEATVEPLIGGRPLAKHISGKSTKKEKHNRKEKVNVPVQ
jgi:hypothetical protein